MCGFCGFDLEHVASLDNCSNGWVVVRSFETKRFKNVPMDGNRRNRASEYAHNHSPWCEMKRKNCMNVITILYKDNSLFGEENQELGWKRQLVSFKQLSPGFISRHFVRISFAGFRKGFNTNNESRRK